MRRTLVALSAAALALGCAWVVDGFSGGTAADGGSAEAGLDAGCPGAHGPRMQRVSVRAGTFCIDSTEVTRGQYAEFVATNPPLQGSGPCAWKTSFLPPADWPDGGSAPSYPIGSVDWCDAFAYCAWAGKRLCGGFDGGSADFNDPANAASSQWYAACSNDGTLIYPYGNAYDAGACNIYPGGCDSGVMGAPAWPAGSVATCTGGYPGLLDMAGNVEEWEDACQEGPGCEAGSGAPCDLCQRRGGSSLDYCPQSFTRCDTPFTPKKPRSATSPDIGFRCCGD